MVLFSAYKCGGLLSATSEVQEITSPGYNSSDPKAAYPESGQQCSWLIDGVNLISCFK